MLIKYSIVHFRYSQIKQPFTRLSKVLAHTTGWYTHRKLITSIPVRHSAVPIPETTFPYKHLLPKRKGRDLYVKKYRA
jgi:hypothetical protein